MDRIHIRLNGNKCWFTSDQHFSHLNVMNFCNRPWDSVGKMNNSLIDNWNKCVGAGDIVFTLGDFYWKKDPDEVKRILDSLHGKHIYILMGNHDTPEHFTKVKSKRIDFISDTVMLHVSGLDEDKPSREYEFMLSHFPLATWPHFKRGTINLHGHIHSGKRTNFDIDKPGYDLFLKPGLTYDVGVDNNDYKPIEIRDVLKNLGKWKKNYWAQ